MVHGGRGGMAYEWHGGVGAVEVYECRGGRVCGRARVMAYGCRGGSARLYTVVYVRVYVWRMGVVEVRFRPS
jgi:hypothetical protein